MMGEMNLNTNSDSRADVERGSWEAEEGRRGPPRRGGAPPYPLCPVHQPTGVSSVPELSPASCLQAFAPPPLPPCCLVAAEHLGKPGPPWCLVCATRTKWLLALLSTFIRDEPFTRCGASTCSLLVLLVSKPRASVLCDLEHIASPLRPQFPLCKMGSTSFSGQV